MKRTTCGKLDKGRKREMNEDFLGMDDENGVYVLGDGMGGHACGEVASNELVRSVLGYFRGKHAESMDNSAVREHIVRSIREANATIYGMATADFSKKGMGTTAVVLVFTGKHYHVGWVGDSRAYLFRRGGLDQLSKDHSRVQLLVDAKVIRAEDARTHPDRNVILMAVGTKDTLEPDYVSGKVKNGDLYLLCSDGITEELDDGEIRTVLGSGMGPEEICAELISLANAKGGTDNQSVIVVRIDER